MSPSLPSANQSPIQIPGHLDWHRGNGELPKLRLTSDSAEAEVYLQGAHITHFQKNGQPPILFTSGSSRYEKGQPSRGGIPLIFPWFGPKEGAVAHGFARVSEWRLIEASLHPTAGVTAKLELETTTYEGHPFTLTLAITLTDTLGLTLITTNNSTDQVLEFEECLHTYFQVGDISTVRILGLNGARYLDKTDGFAEKVETRERIDIASETDRVYQDTTDTVDIVDPSLGRTLRVEKTGSRSTVVWNPWEARAKQLPDFGDEEYHRMVCVESGNVGTNRVRLAPGETSQLSVILSVVPPLN